MDVFDILKKHSVFEDRKVISTVLPIIGLKDGIALSNSYTRFYDNAGVVQANVGVGGISFLYDCLTDAVMKDAATLSYLGVALEHEKHHVRQIQSNYQRRDCDIDVLKDFLMCRENSMISDALYWYQLPELDAYKESVIRARDWVAPIVGEEVLSNVVCEWYNKERFGEPIAVKRIDDLDLLPSFFDRRIEECRKLVGIANCDVSKLDNDLVKRYVEAGSVDNDAILEVMKNPSPDRKQRDMLAAMFVAVNPLYEIWFPILKNDDAMGHSYCQWRDRFRENVPECLRVSGERLDELVRNAQAEAREHVATNLVWSLPFVDKLERTFDNFGL